MQTKYELQEKIMSASFEQMKAMRKDNKEEDLKEVLDNADYLSYLEFLRIFHLSVLFLAKAKIEKENNSVSFLPKTQQEEIFEICTENGIVVEVEKEFLVAHFGEDLSILMRMEEKKEAIAKEEEKLPEKIEEAAINYDTEEVKKTKSHEVQSTLSYEEVTKKEKQEETIQKEASFERFEDVKKQMQHPINTDISLVAETEIAEEKKENTKENVKEIKEEITRPVIEKEIVVTEAAKQEEKKEEEAVKETVIEEKAVKETETKIETDNEIKIDEEIKRLPKAPVTEIVKDGDKKEKPVKKAYFEYKPQQAKKEEQIEETVEKTEDKSKDVMINERQTSVKEITEAKEEDVSEKKDVSTVDVTVDEKDGEKAISTFFLDQHIINLNGVSYLINVYPMTFLENDPVSTPIFVTSFSTKGSCRAWISKNNSEKNITMIIDSVRIVVRAKWIKGQFSSQLNLLDPDNEFNDKKTEIRPSVKTMKTHLIMDHQDVELHIFPAIFSNDKKTGLCPCVVYTKENGENNIFIPTGLLQTSYRRNTTEMLEMYIEGTTPTLKVTVSE